MFIVPLVPAEPRRSGHSRGKRVGRIPVYFRNRRKTRRSRLLPGRLEDRERNARNGVSRLAQPLLGGFDFVTPCYARSRFEGLLNNSIVSPLTRSLYGKRIQNPMGPDLGVSRRLYQDVLAANQDTATTGNGIRLLAGLAPVACGGDFKIGQAYLGSRIYPPVDWTNVSSLLTEILGPVFEAMDKNAVHWQQTRSSSPVATLNESTPPTSQATETLEIARLVNSFQLGLRDLREIWGLVLPPATLFELLRVSPDKFRIPDELLWVRIIYDFAFGAPSANHQPLSSAPFTGAAIPWMGRLLRSGV